MHGGQLSQRCSFAAPRHELCLLQARWASHMVTQDEQKVRNENTALRGNQPVCVSHLRLSSR